MSTPNANVEVVSVTVTPALAKAIRILARTDKNRSASELTDDLLAQVVRGRLKAKAKSAKKDFAEKWELSAQIVGADKMPISKADYVEKAVQELKDIISAIA